MSSLGEMLPLEYVGPLAGGGAVPLAGVCNPGVGTASMACKPGSYTAGGGCQPTGYATGGAWCNLGNGTCLN